MLPAQVAIYLSASAWQQAVRFDLKSIDRCQANLIMKLILALSGALALPLIKVNGYSFSNEQFDSREATIDSIHTALFSGIVSCRDVVSSFIARIEAFNPTVNAIISLNPNAMTRADEFDAKLASGNATGSLFCIPVLLKDNYDTAELNTTGSCLALAGNKPMQDAPAVAALRAAGAIIMGKTNLHELALEGLSVSSLGGQTSMSYHYPKIMFSPIGGENLGAN